MLSRNTLRHAFLMYWGGGLQWRGSRSLGLDMKLEARGSARARQGLARARPGSKVGQAKPKPAGQASRLDKPARWSLQAGSKAR